MSKIILKEYFELFRPTKEFLSESMDAIKEGKPFRVKGVIQRANCENQNGRIYPKHILKKEVDRYLKDFVKKGIALGELDHEDDSVISLKNVSHIIRDIGWDGDDVLGDVEILPTPAGDIAIKLALAGIPLGISSRALGSVNKNESTGADVVEEDLQLVCWDLVGTPSTHGAFLHQFESKQYNAESNLTENVDSINEILKDILSK